MEHYHGFRHKLSPADKKAEATKRAKQAFSEVTKQLKFPFVPVSTQKEALKECGGPLI